MLDTLEKEIKSLKDEKVKLNEQVKKTKKELQDVTEKLTKLENKKELLINKANLDTEITVQDLWDKFNNLDYKQDLKASRGVFHVTPLKEEDLEFYSDKISIKNLKYRFVISLYFNDRPDGISIQYAYLYAFTNKYASDTSITIISQDCTNIDLDILFKEYVRLRNQYIAEKTEYTNTLIPIKVYWEVKKDYADLSSYLKVIRQKDDFDLLNSFAQEFDVNTQYYYICLGRLNKEQLHEIAQSFRDNKEQFFRWNLSSKWRDTTKAGVEFDMTPIFTAFKKHGVEVNTPRRCSGNGGHYNHQFTLDGRKYEAQLQW